MVTFLPYPDFARCAEVLDQKRLGKQRVECLQLLIGIYFQELKNNISLSKDIVPDLNIFCKNSYGTEKHPASKMWKNNRLMLISYTIAMCNEWSSRGYQDSIKNRVTRLVSPLYPADTLSQQYIVEHYPAQIPSWLGDERLHRSHRSNLIRKFPEHYSQYWQEPDNISYYWPV
jgi:hypothetical protein